MILLTVTTLTVVVELNSPQTFTPTTTVVITPRILRPLFTLKIPSPLICLSYAAHWLMLLKNLKKAITLKQTRPKAHPSEDAFKL